MIYNNIELKYNNTLCNCLQTFFINDSNTLAKELMKITNYNQGTCIKSLIDPKIYNIIWISFSSFVAEELKQKFIISHIIRKHCDKNTQELNFNYTEDLYYFVQQLIKEFVEYVEPCLTKSDIKVTHRDYYADKYKLYVNSDMYLKDKALFYDNINPLYTFNYNFKYANPWACILENCLKVIFVPNIYNIIKHARISKTI